MDTYAYEQGYDRGFEGRPLRPFPEQAGPEQILWLKAGWADGDWDRSQGNPRATSSEVATPGEREPLLVRCKRLRAETGCSLVDARAALLAYSYDDAKHYILTKGQA